MEGKLGSVFKHVYKSPVGNVIILIEEDFLTSLSFLENTKNINITKNPMKFKHIVAQLDEYFYEGRKSFRLDYKLKSTNFREKDIYIDVEIPYGKTISYADLAKRAGKPLAYRAVGTACGKNPLPLIIHFAMEVISQQGLGGFTGGLKLRISLKPRKKLKLTDECHLT